MKQDAMVQALGPSLSHPSPGYRDSERTRSLQPDTCQVISTSSVFLVVQLQLNYFIFLNLDTEA